MTESRPFLSITEAAEAAGKSRRSIGRMLDSGRLDGAKRDEAGTWRIPVDALLAAGLSLHAPSPPDDVPAPQETAPAPDALNALRVELADWRRRAEVAEAIAAERADALSDARLALRALTTGTTPPDPPTVEPRPRWWRKARP